jgi:hypothetical protein
MICLHVKLAQLIHVAFIFNKTKTFFIPRKGPSVQPHLQFHGLLNLVPLASGIFVVVES